MLNQPKSQENRTREPELLCIIDNLPNVKACLISGCGVMWDRNCGGGALQLVFDVCGMFFDKCG